jgi:hypothetical protein
MRKAIVRRWILPLGFLSALLAVTLYGYQGQAGFAQRSRDAETRGLAEPFKGITARGEIETGLFPIRPSGVSTEPVRKAAEVFLAALTEDQRRKTMFEVDDPEWRKWMNQDFYVRQGMGFVDMTEAQREAAIGLLRASLSAKGLKLTRDVMRLNHTLGELSNNDFDRFGEWRYWITVMGTPSATEPWGWQFDGHHAIINYFVLGDRPRGKISGHVRAAGRAEQGTRDGSVSDRRAAGQGGDQRIEDGQQQSDRSVQRQRRARLCRAARRRTFRKAEGPATRTDCVVRREHG